MISHQNFFSKIVFILFMIYFPIHYVWAVDFETNLTQEEQVEKSEQKDFQELKDYIFADFLSLDMRAHLAAQILSNTQEAKIFFHLIENEFKTTLVPEIFEYLHSLELKKIEFRLNSLLEIATRAFFVKDASEYSAESISGLAQLMVNIFSLIAENLPQHKVSNSPEYRSDFNKNRALFFQELVKEALLTLQYLELISYRAKSVGVSSDEIKIYFQQELISLKEVMDKIYLLFQEKMNIFPDRSWRLYLRFDPNEKNCEAQLNKLTEEYLLKNIRIEKESKEVLSRAAQLRALRK